MDADITQELAVIKAQPGGNAVKTAIRSALSKLAETRGGTVVQEFEAGQCYDMPAGLIDACVDGIEDEYTTITQDKTSETYQQGAGNGQTGSMPVTSTTRLCCLDYFDIPEGAYEVKVTVLGSATSSSIFYDVDLYVYDENGFLYDGGWSSPNGFVTQLMGSKCRIIIGKNNGSTIVPSELTSVTFEYHK